MDTIFLASGIITPSSFSFHTSALSFIFYTSTLFIRMDITYDSLAPDGYNFLLSEEDYAKSETVFRIFSWQVNRYEINLVVKRRVRRRDLRQEL